MPDTITVQVIRGTKVNVQEVDNLSDDDSRIPNDRTAIIKTPKAMKVAVKSGDSDLQAKASVVLTCG